MEKVVEKEKVEEKNGNIDDDVLDVMKQEDILKAISDDKQVKRLILNCFCEFLSEIKGLRDDFDGFMNMITLCSADKLSAFFKELNKNVEDEEKRVDLQKKIQKSHKKSTKKNKK